MNSAAGSRIPWSSRPTFLRSAIFLFSLLALSSSVLAQSESYGEITVSIRSQPKGSTTHGYSEYVFSVTNRSEKKHTVTLSFPREKPGGLNEDHLANVTRTIDVDEKSTTLVPLLYPDFPPLIGSDLQVMIDGRIQGRSIPLNVMASRGAHPTYRRGGFVAYTKKVTSGPNQPLLLVSSRASEKFRYPEPEKELMGVPEPPGGPAGGGGPAKRKPGGVPRGGAESKPIPAVIAPAPPGPPGAVPPGGPPMPPAKPFVPVSLENLQRSPEPVTNWSPRWLSYSRYDGIVLMQDEFEFLDRGSSDLQAIRMALVQYVEAGGCLLLLGGDGNDNPPTNAIPASWKRLQNNQFGFQVSQPGFGLFLQKSNRDATTWDNPAWIFLARCWMETEQPFMAQLNAEQVNSSLPIIDDIALPVRGLFLLMLLFSFTIGPLNIWLLSRWNRRIWLLWTVPLLSLLTCLSVFSYMIVSEGWKGRNRIYSFTLLDETEQRATTLGRSAVYSPLTPSDGLHFPADTEVNLLGRDGAVSSAICEIDWTRDQHLTHGWVSARSPSQFQLRRSEIKRLERLPVSKEGNGTLMVTNQLGATIANLWLADDQGKIYTAEAVPVGQRVALTPWKSPGKILNKTLRQMYQGGNWANVTNWNAEYDLGLVRPGTYLAVLDSSPFLEPSLRGSDVKPTPSVVLGMMARE